MQSIGESAGEREAAFAFSNGVVLNENKRAAAQDEQRPARHVVGDVHITFRKMSCNILQVAVVFLKEKGNFASISGPKACPPG